MINYIRYLVSTGQIVAITSSADTNLTITPEVGEDILLIEGDLLNPREIYVENGQVLTLPAQDNYYQSFNWTTKQFEYPVGYLDVAKADAIAKIKAETEAAILSSYSLYDQINLPRLDSVAAQAMHSWIDSEEATKATAIQQITNCTTLQEIEVTQEFYGRVAPIGGL